MSRWLLAAAAGLVVLILAHRRCPACQERWASWQDLWNGR